MIILSEAVEVPAVKVEPKKKRIVKNPQPKLDADRLAVRLSSLFISKTVFV